MAGLLIAATSLAITCHHIRPEDSFYEQLLPLVQLQGAHNSTAFNNGFVATSSTFFDMDDSAVRFGGVVTVNAANMVKIGRTTELQWISRFNHTANLFVRDVMDSSTSKLMLSSMQQLYVKFRTSHRCGEFT